MVETSKRSMVIDASIARAAGESDYPISKMSRDFLNVFSETEHEMVMTDDLIAEWNKHQSKMALIFRRRMTERERVVFIEDVVDEELRSLIEKSTKDASRIPAMMKDIHLIEAALESDEIVISKDDKVRNHFCSVVDSVEVLRTIVWINPTNENEHGLEWLQCGAYSEEARRLENWISR